VVGGLGDLEKSAGVRNCLALSKQLVSRFELADDLFGCVPGGFHGEVPGTVCPDEDSPSHWTDFWGPRQATGSREIGGLTAPVVRATQIGDTTLLAYAEVLPDEKQATTVGFVIRAVTWFNSQRITCRKVLSDNGNAYRSKRGSWPGRHRG